MNIPHPIATLAVGIVSILLVSCASEPEWKIGPDGKPINPYPLGTYKHFTAEPSYPMTYKAWKHVQLLPETNPSNCLVRIDLKKQRGYLMNGDQIVLDYPICSGTKDRPTPTGEFTILEKKVDKRSNLYGKIYDAEGNCVNRDADITKDVVPEGGRFVGAPMMNWMRLTNGGVGHHIGPVKRKPASHGCIRGPKGVIPTVFEKVAVGSTVRIE